MKWFFALLLSAWTAQATTITAASGSPTDVQSAMNSASAGDTVVIPAGSNNWTAGVSWTVPAGVTLRGAGTTATGGGDATIIKDNVASGSPVFDLTLSSSGVFRLSGITVMSGTGDVKDGGTIKLVGPGIVRLDHLHLVAFSNANYKIVLVGSAVYGVLDHSILDFKDSDSIYVFNGRNSGGDVAGNYEWTLPTAFGGADYFFIEDNIVNGYSSLSSYDARLYDGFTAARVVTRFNTVVSTTLGETHATGHSADDRGTRSLECYGNLVTSPLTLDPNYAAIDCKNGTSLVWGNSWNQVYKNLLNLRVTRSDNSAYTQTAVPNGWGYAGTNFNGTGSIWDGGTAYGTNLGTGYPDLDQAGRGPGDLLVGVFPTKTNNATGTIFWPRQALEPVYIWNNTGTIVAGWGGFEYNNDTLRVVTNRDFYPQASGIQTTPSSPFNGTVGTGWGTLANRPTTCTAGVGYFATDVGSWNTSITNQYGVQQNGADGVLYKATATDTWTLYYTPYTYPHPLNTNSGPITASTTTINATTVIVGP